VEEAQSAALRPGTPCGRSVRGAEEAIRGMGARLHVVRRRAPTGKSFAAWGEGISYTGPGGVWFNRQTP
jgi:hypothetical protein